MRDISTCTDVITDVVDRYARMNILDGEELSHLTRRITAAMYYLNNERVKYHDLWQRHVKELIDSGSSVSRAENEAHVKYPELYLLRRTMDAAKDCYEAMRSNISWVKFELNTSKDG